MKKKFYKKQFDKEREEKEDWKKRYTKFRRDNKCRFCRDKREVDYKDVGTLIRLCTSRGKLYSRKRSGNCAYHQRLVKIAIKRARFLALVPYVGS